LQLAANQICAHYSDWRKIIILQVCFLVSKFQKNIRREENPATPLNSMATLLAFAIGSFLQLVADLRANTPEWRKHLKWIALGFALTLAFSFISVLIKDEQMIPALWVGWVLGFFIAAGLNYKELFGTMREENLILPTVLVWYVLITQYQLSGRGYLIFYMCVLAPGAAFTLFHALTRKPLNSTFERGLLYTWCLTVQLFWGIVLIYRFHLGHKINENIAQDPMGFAEMAFTGALMSHYILALGFLFTFFPGKHERRWGARLKRQLSELGEKFQERQYPPAMGVASIALYTGLIVMNHRMRFLPIETFACFLLVIDPWISRIALKKMGSIHTIMRSLPGR
jgi:hypothetical protein